MYALLIHIQLLYLRLPDLTVHINSMETNVNKLDI